jgi:excisionase family DNA binding protein
MQPNVTTVSEAAEKKNCGRNTIYRAVERGELNTAEVGKQRMILLDDAFERFEPMNRGARVARQKGEGSQ